MKRNVVRKLAVAGFALLSATSAIANATPAIANVEVYPGPGVATYQSQRYFVEVQQGMNWVSSYVYSYKRSSVTLWHWGTSPSVNFTTFGTNGIANVRVSMPGGFISSADVSPKSKNIPLQVINGQALLTLTPNEKAWITLNRDDADPLFVFADNLKPAVPSGATYFGPGVRDIAPLTANHYSPSNGETIYLDGGAWVRGNIDVEGKTNVTIMGPGVLAGDLWASEAVQSAPTFTQMMGFAMIRGDFGGTNATVEGITIVASPTYNLYGGVHSAEDVKLLSPWYWSTDGFQGVSLVDESFAFVGDNVFFPVWAGLANNGVQVTHSFAGTTNNAVFCGGFWGHPASEGHGAMINDIDIKTYNSDAWVQYGAPLTPAVFQIWVDNNVSTNGYSNQTYENIRVEGDIGAPLAILKNMAYPWAGATTYNPPLGNSYNLVFQNIRVSGTQKDISEIKGFDANNGFHNVTFQTLTIGGTSVTQANFKKYFDVNAYVTGLSFVN